MRTARRWFALALIVALSCLAAAATERVAFSVEDIEGPGFAAKQLAATLQGPGLSVLELRIGELTALGQSWRDLKISCQQFRIERRSIECARGAVETGSRWPLTFRFAPDDGGLEIALLPGRGESWRMVAQSRRSAQEIALTVVDGSLARLSPWLPKALPPVQAGTLSGTVRLSLGAGTRVDADIVVGALAFSDAAGLHAGEKNIAAIKLSATREKDLWRWRGSTDWQGGEVFWQPFFLAGAGQRLQAAGTFEAGVIDAGDATLLLPGIGELALTARYDIGAGALRDAGARSAEMAAGPLYQQFFKPLLTQTSFTDLQVAGHLGLEWIYRAGATRRLDVDLRRISVVDGRGRFALREINARVPWQSDAPVQSDVRIGSAQLFGVAIGDMRIPMQLDGSGVAVARARVPLFDGALTIEDFAARTGADGWQWSFGAQLAPVSMQRLTQELGWPPMHGTFSAKIPRVSYARSTVSVDGALLFEVFDGRVTAQNLRLDDPLGRAPRFHADVGMSRLDLDLVTRAFSFGSMTGRIDGRIAGLELVNWAPVAFDAAIVSSPGEYPRKISQTAVQNISSLGGAGAGAAIQRSFLRFFDQFGYQRLGLSCVLRDGTCSMDGIARAPQGYVIVEGGGIPAITVLGYNRRVDWNELIQRIQRITRDNVKPVVE